MSDDSPVPRPEPLNEALAAFQSMPVPDPPSSVELVARLTSESELVSRSYSSNRRRVLMRFASWSAAAAVLLAGGVVFLGMPSAVALADVVKAAEKHSLVKYKITERSDQEDGKAPGSGSTTSVSYADLKTPRFRSERKVVTFNGAVESAYYTVQDNAKGRMLSVLRETAVEGAERDAATVELLRNVSLPRLEATLSSVGATETPAVRKTLLENLHELEEHTEAKSTRETVDGRALLKYEVEDGPRTTTLWVDAGTKLPVRLKMVQVGNGKLTVEFSDFEWDPKLTGFKNLDELFDTNPPAGYRVNDQTKQK